jgi:hypothetical protein
MKTKSSTFCIRAYFSYWNDNDIRVSVSSLRAAQTVKLEIKTPVEF